MKRLSVLLLVLSLILVPTAAKAHHIEFSSQVQNGGIIEMYTFYKWQAYSIYYPGSSYNHLRYLRWKAGDLGTEQMMASALTEWIAIANLNGTGDYQPWLNVTNDTQTPDLLVYGTNCPFSPDTVGCVVIDSFNYNGTSDAQRWATARLYVDPTPSIAPYQTANDQKSVYVHELGHLLARDEGYQHSPPACGASNTIMDAMILSGGYLRHCDSISAPTANDKASHQTYFTLGYVTQVNALQQSGNNLVFAYQDYAWEEWGTFVEYQKMENGSWVMKGNTTLTAQIGTRNNVQVRIINYAHPVKTLWGTGTYRVKARPWFGTRSSGVPNYGSVLTTASIVIN